jgi:hypothetical protein
VQTPYFFLAPLLSSHIKNSLLTNLQLPFDIFVVITFFLPRLIEGFIVFYAIAEMLLRRSLLRQSNPSTLTAAGVCPNFIRVNPPLTREDGDSGATA